VVAASDGDDAGDDQQRRKNQAPHEPAVHGSPSRSCEHHAARNAPARGRQSAADLRARRHPIRTRTAVTATRSHTSCHASSVVVTVEGAALRCGDQFQDSEECGRCRLCSTGTSPAGGDAMPMQEAPPSDETAVEAELFAVDDPLADRIEQLTLRAENHREAAADLLRAADRAEAQARRLRAYRSAAFQAILTAPALVSGRRRPFGGGGATVPAEWEERSDGAPVDRSAGSSGRQAGRSGAARRVRSTPPAPATAGPGRTRSGHRDQRPGRIRQDAAAGGLGA
jgi:hypothetical protein